MNLDPRAVLKSLEDAGVEDPAADYRRLFNWAFALGQQASESQTREDPNAVTRARLEEGIAQRLERKPISQIIGTRAFWSHDFIVSSDVLDPRPDTETLVERALNAPFERVLDLGTGSGCILLSLLAERETSRGLGVDLSEPALAIARANADNLGLSERAEFRTSDWFSDVTGAFDLIVSNPPYIDAATYKTLAPEVRNWEPKSALEAGADGLDAYRVISQQTSAFLEPGGRLLLEIGFDQGRAVTQLLEATGVDDINVFQDLNGRDRVVSARKTGQK